MQVNSNFVKTSKKTLKTGKELAKTQKLYPNEIYQACIKPDCIISSMKGLKQAQYCKECVNKEENKGRGNPADQWLEVIKQVQDKDWPYVRYQFMDDTSGLPNTIIYSDQQIEDIRNLCGSTSDPSTVLGVSISFL